jgi:hypothetical protein
MSAATIEEKHKSLPGTAQLGVTLSVAALYEAYSSDLFCTIVRG